MIPSAGKGIYLHAGHQLLGKEQVQTHILPYRGKLDLSKTNALFQNHRVTGCAIFVVYGREVAFRWMDGLCVLHGGSNVFLAISAQQNLKC